MKWLKAPFAIVLLLVALYFAYNSFESSFNPRRGQGKGGPPPMPAGAMKSMAARQQAKQAATQKADEKKEGDVSIAKETASKETPKKGGE